MNVSLGSSTPGASAPVSLPRQPWVLLVCADLGFNAAGPRRISAATLNEFLATGSVTVSGNVETGLPDDIAPFHIEYRITDVKDFSPASLAEKMELFNDLKRASVLLDEISRKKITADDGVRTILSLNLPQSIIRQLGTVKPKSGVLSRGKAPGVSAASASKIDSILSMMDVDSGAETPAAAPAQPADFVAAFTENAAGDFSSAAILRCRESVDRLLANLGATVTRQPFFRAAAGSWNALKTLLKIAGRNRDIHIFVHSAPFDAAQRHFSDALGVCASQSAVPDIVVWDYPVSTDTATMQQLEHIGEQADRFKTVVITSLDYHDDLYTKIIEREPLKTVFEQPAYIPLRRLRESGAARCLSLCAPDAVVQRNRKDMDVAVTGGWLLAVQWMTSYIDHAAPFHLQNSSITALDAFGFPQIPGEVALDAHRNGLTVLRPGGVTAPRVLLGDESSPYGSLLFNLAVNRTARLAAEWIGGQDRMLFCEAAAPVLEEFLRIQLAPYDILSSSGAVSVAVVDQQSLQITVDSTGTVAGFPVKFQFSFSYR